MDEKYSFRLDVIVLESKTCSLFIIISSGMLLFLDSDPLFKALKCFQMLLGLFEVSTEPVMYLCFSFLIRCFVLFLYFFNILTIHLRSKRSFYIILNIDKILPLNNASNFTIICGEHNHFYKVYIGYLAKV